MHIHPIDRASEIYDCCKGLAKKQNAYSADYIATKQVEDIINQYLRHKNFLETVNNKIYIFDELKYTVDKIDYWNKVKNELLMLLKSQ